MAIDRQDHAARELIHYAFNPGEVAKRPLASFPQVLRPGGKFLSSQYRPITTETIYYKDPVPQGQRVRVEQRRATLIAENIGDIMAFAEKPEFVLPQVVVANPSADPRDWEAYAWFRSPSEVLDKLEAEDAVHEYTQLLKQRRVPTVAMYDVSPSESEALHIIARDNSKYIQDGGKEVRKPINERQLVDIADTYDVSLQPFWLRFSGTLNNFVNLSGTDVLASTLMTPAQRARCLLMVNPQEQANFMNSKIGEAFAAIGTRLNGNALDLMGDILRRMTWSHKGASHGDVLKGLGLSGDKQELAVVSQDKLVCAVNLPSEKLVAMAFMDPQTRLEALTKEQQAQAYAKGWRIVRDNFLNDNPAQSPYIRAGLNLWRDADKLLAA